MKKYVTLMLTVVLVCGCFSVAVSAIDTPWLPIKPDSETTETLPPSQNEENNATDTDTDGSRETETSFPESETQSNTEAERNDFVESEGEAETNSTGCGSALGGYAVLACCLTASVCVAKARKDNE